VSLRYALLALLRVGPMSGYELQKEFSLSVGHVWHAPDSQIYPELRKMEAEGLVAAEEQARGERGTRRPYHVTEEGDRAFLDWMQAPLEYSRVRDPAHVKAAYLETTTRAAAHDFLVRHIAQWRSECEQWQNELHRINARENPMLVRRLAVTPEKDRDTTVAFKRFSYEGLVSRAQAEIAWAERGLRLLDELGYNPASSPPAG
jgi:DNA-binding PadR family transcriptional regulator